MMSVVTATASLSIDEVPLPPSPADNLRNLQPPVPPPPLPPPQQLRRQFSILCSTEDNNKSDDSNFYGPFAHIRKTLDYSYHSNYKKERQFFQDSIIEEFLDNVQIEDINGDVCTTPTEPWIVFTAGAMGAGKSHTINELVKRNRFPLLAFVSVDPDEIRRRLPEFRLYAEKCPNQAGELTRKEAGYVAEILTFAALQAGKNVLVDGSLRDSEWYKQYFARLREEYTNVEIAILHVVAPREAVLQRAADRAIKTGRVVPQHTLEAALEQVPKSVKILAPLADYFCELNNAPGADDIELLTPDEDWDTFQANWLQTCAYVPGKNRNKPFSSRHDASKAAIKAFPPIRKAHRRSFSVLSSTEENHKSEDSNYYGPYSHIRKNLDYGYHSNYKKERQWLQDAIITDLTKTVKFTDKHGNVCTTPEDPWLIFTAGAQAVGKSHALKTLLAKDRFPLNAYVLVDHDEIRLHLPEYNMYVDQMPKLAEEMTRKEVGTMGEIIQMSALQAGKNVLVDGTLRDKDWYKQHIQRLRNEFPNLRIAILHVTAPKEAIFERAEKRCREVGHFVSRDVIEKALEQVPDSVETLRPLVDYCVELRNNPDTDDVELCAEGETWESFRNMWLQTCLYIPGAGNCKKE